jgi:MoaA/NifB/PqqE/SkfB family radical SAM enzyme
MFNTSFFNEKKKKLLHTYSFVTKKLIHLNLQILYDCNFRCKICDFWKENASSLPRLTISQIRTISDKLKALRPQIISLGGGEPLLHEDIIDITEILSDNNFLMMISNGWFITPEISKALWQAGMNHILISLDYADARKHDKMRGKKEAFNKGVNAIKILNEQRIYASQRVQIVATILDDNQEEIEPLLRLARELGVSLIVSLYCKCRGVVKHEPIVRDLTPQLLYLKKRNRNFVSMRGYITRFSEAVQTEHGVQPCYAGKNLFNINCNGDVTLCIDHLENPVGNILTDDIFEIEKKLLARYESNMCGDCWTSCRGHVETLMYGDHMLANLWDYYQFSRPVPLNRPF